ncbi:RWD domain-containing protein/zf-RING_2 domain-containing protein [Cephalotus follicularis]|uniref:RWD domain-containing protein/zf-RING_2 domain-containing protein n=1 Tax=Cephalotus follicularis TaxID=3775 RepID=A0A1Q3BT55_CEPFO|nr:RWD domain-containing protein/zf-RING_2 domain-containing protein [Cephalotus follicularis]
MLGILKKMGQEEEVVIEVEAVQSVYGDDCFVLDFFPPHLHIHMKPRTADVSSQQFVEAVIDIRAGPQYPQEPPCIDLIESKGLDERRQKDLMNTIRDKAHKLSSSLMLVAICEEAVERLSDMNHPDGDCPLCLCPLASEDKQDKILPFMKLMSCFHCFHSECIIRWWRWLHTERETSVKDSSSAMETKEGMHGVMETSMGYCPVCRKVFHAEDFEHVLDLVGTHSFQMKSNGTEVIDADSLLQSDTENIRRQKFEAILKLQQENSGLIEPKRDLLIQPGMFLPQAVSIPAAKILEQTTKQHQRDPAVHSESINGSSSKRPSTSKHRNSGTRQQRPHPRQPVRQWIKKENGAAT